VTVLAAARLPPNPGLAFFKHSNILQALEV
jgi:hypothetical protein